MPFLVFTCVQKTYNRAYEKPPKIISEVAYIYKNNHLRQNESIDRKNYVYKMPSKSGDDVHVIIEIVRGPHEVNIRPFSSKFSS